jgi:hypothetical protein
VSSIVAESVAKIAAMNQHVTGPRTKLFVLAMSVAYQNNPQLSVPHSVSQSSTRNPSIRENSPVLWLTRMQS